MCSRIKQCRQPTSETGDNGAEFRGAVGTPGIDRAVAWWLSARRAEPWVAMVAVTLRVLRRCVTTLLLALFCLPVAVLIFDTWPPRPHHHHEVPVTTQPCGGLVFTIHRSYIKYEEILIKSYFYVY